MALNLPAFNSEKIADVVRTLRQWRDLLQDVLRLPPASAQGIEIVTTVISGDNEVAHKLGATPSGWIVTRIQGTAGCALAEVTSDSKTLTLHATANATVTLWVWP